MRLTEPNMINVVLLGHIDQGWFTALDHCRHVAYNFIFNLDTNTLGSSQRLSDNVQRMHATKISLSLRWCAHEHRTRALRFSQSSLTSRLDPLPLRRPVARGKAETLRLLPVLQHLLAESHGGVVSTAERQSKQLPEVHPTQTRNNMSEAFSLQ